MLSWFRIPKLQNEKGQSMVEYALILALVSLAAMIALQSLGNNIAGIFQRLADLLSIL